MDSDQNPADDENARSNQGTLALKRLMERGRVPLRFVTTYILITGYGRTWREVAADLGVTPGTIGYQLRQVKGALERMLLDEGERY